MRFDAPFPHVVLDHFVPPDLIYLVNATWPDDWNKEDGRFNKKWSRPRLTEAAEMIASRVDVRMVSAVTDIRGLFADPDLFGAGLHCIPAGGFLKMHTDFGRHPNGWHRRVNVLIYLNQEWRDEWNGHLQLGLGSDAKRIAPIAGRCVIFETTDTSWHGHPEPLTCPENIQRRSLALYYYTDKAPYNAAGKTTYRKAA